MAAFASSQWKARDRDSVPILSGVDRANLNHPVVHRWLLDLKSEATRFNNNNISAAIVADVGDFVTKSYGRGFWYAHLPEQPEVERQGRLRDSRR